MTARSTTSVSVGISTAAFLTAVLLLVAPASASATALTSPTGTVDTPTVELESEGYVTLDAKVGNEDKPAPCKLSMTGLTRTHGKGQPVIIELSIVTFTECTNNWHITVETLGSFEIEGTTGYDGTVTWSGMTFVATWLKGTMTCKYKAEKTHIGTLTGGSPATIHLEGSLAFGSGSPLCGEAPRQLTGSVKIKSPSALFVDKETTSLTAPTGTVATPTLKAESEGHIGIDHPLTTIQCQWSLEGTTSSHNGGAVVIPLTSLTTSGCTDSWHATTVTPGKLEITKTSGYNGTVRWTGGTVELTRSGTTCSYKTDSTDLGTITAGSPATIDIEGKLPFHGGSALCGTEAYPLTGSFKVTSPSALYVDS